VGQPILAGAFACQGRTAPALPRGSQSVILKHPGERVLKKTTALLLPLWVAAGIAQDTVKRPPITGVAHI